jgi:WD40 repeat protein
MQRIDHLKPSNCPRVCAIAQKFVAVCKKNQIELFVRLPGSSRTPVRSEDAYDHYESICEVLNGHEADVSALSFSPDEQWLVSGASDGLRMWNMHEVEENILLERATVPRTLRLDYGEYVVQSVKYNSSGTLFALSLTAIRST